MGVMAMKRRVFTLFLLLAVGFSAGLINGLLGAGGGILIVFGLNKLSTSSSWDKHSVFATALAVILPLSLLTVFQYLKRGSLDAQGLGVLILPAIAGGALGGSLLRRLSSRFLSRLFAVIVLASGVVLVV